MDRTYGACSRNVDAFAQALLASGRRDSGQVAALNGIGANYGPPLERYFPRWTVHGRKRHER